ncbi:hypothetical protein PsalMR5_04915 (plasmid) [Piscirickettsia salmonis]|uniref:hypothetical protein n=1 Tax=Piscirickettsia salmonis TaxID=1238 RepID=UPI0012BB060F|nr:hypothetical protein [Piscirickettsia salmonis]QGP57395.1 hypothetical protein PsalSR1_04884 [Piscirickettsia salmonis]QGP66990.1 hypothetical protein PsalMR5_04915 [Piscirickettsia salmonis]
MVTNLKPINKVGLYSFYNKTYDNFFHKEIEPYFSSNLFFIGHMCVSVVTPNNDVIILSKLKDIEEDYEANPMSRYDRGFDPQLVHNEDMWDWSEGHTKYNHELTHLKSNRYNLYGGKFIKIKVKHNDQTFFLVIGVAARSKKNLELSKILIDFSYNHFLMMIKKIATQTYLTHRDCYQRFTQYSLPIESDFDKEIICYSEPLIFPTNKLKIIK